MDGRKVTWNLVAGIHDAPRQSERTVWLDGVASEVAPVTFKEDLAGLAFADGGELHFSAEATRSRRDNFLVMASSYTQPFGTASGTSARGRGAGRGLRRDGAPPGALVSAGAAGFGPPTRLTA